MVFSLNYSSKTRQKKPRELHETKAGTVENWKLSNKSMVHLYVLVLQNSKVALFYVCVICLLIFMSLGRKKIKSAVHICIILKYPHSHWV
jgi:hypothetical protein